MKRVIDIENFLSGTITSRKAIEVLRSYSTLTGNSSYVFDFSNIDFISGSFAYERFNFIEKKNISATFVNVNSNVEQILKSVQKNRSKRINSFHKIAVTTFEEKEEMNKFLSLI